MNRSHKLFVLLIFAVGSLIFLFFQLPDTYDMTSFEFVDQRRFLGIPNFMDVISNIPFLIVGIMGLRLLKKHPQREAKMVLASFVYRRFIGSFWFLLLSLSPLC